MSSEKAPVIQEENSNRLPASSPGAGVPSSKVDESRHDEDQTIRVDNRRVPRMDATNSELGEAKETTSTDNGGATELEDTKPESSPGPNEESSKSIFGRPEADFTAIMSDLVLVFLGGDGTLKIRMRKKAFNSRWDWSREYLEKLGKPVPRCLRRQFLRDEGKEEPSCENIVWFLVHSAKTASSSKDPIYKKVFILHLFEAIIHYKVPQKDIFAYLNKNKVLNPDMQNGLVGDKRNGK